MIYYKGNKLDEDELDFVLSQIKIDLKYLLKNKTFYSLTTYKREVNDNLINYEFNVTTDDREDD